MKSTAVKIFKDMSAEKNVLEVGYLILLWKKRK